MRFFLMFFNRLANTVFTRPKRSAQIDGDGQERQDVATPEQIQTQAHRSQLMNWFRWNRSSAS